MPITTITIVIENSHPAKDSRHRDFSNGLIHSQGTADRLTILELTEELVSTGNLRPQNAIWAELRFTSKMAARVTAFPNNQVAAPNVTQAIIAIGQVLAKTREAGMSLRKSPLQITGNSGSDWLGPIAAIPAYWRWGREARPV